VNVFSLLFGRLSYVGLLAVFSLDNRVYTSPIIEWESVLPASYNLHFSQDKHSDHVFLPLRMAFCRELL
jgi:hypothetical protein